MDNQNYVLGIDTSNYKTSVALTDRQGSVIFDLRKPLLVKDGMRGLRQSDAFFQHTRNLPELLKSALGGDHRRKIKAVSCSDKPRPVEGSYMPVFMAGQSFAETVAAALEVPCFSFSHQEGHIASIKQDCDLKEEEAFLCYHLSGGTCELLKVNAGIEIIGGSKDISFGQVIDRIGVGMGMRFPAGEEMDRRALSADAATGFLKIIPSEGLYFNLSGIETQCGRVEYSKPDQLIRELFDRISEILIKITERATEATGIDHVIFTGGVASSQYISRRIKEHFFHGRIRTEFGRQEFSQDNAVGIALLGGAALWQ